MGSSNRLGVITITGLLAAICCGVSYGILHKEDTCLSLRNYDYVQSFHIAGIITGIILLIFGICDLSNALRGLLILFILVVACTIVMGCLVIYAAILEFKMPCVSIIDEVGSFLKNKISGEDHNIFTAKDGHMIAVFFSDLISGAFFFTSALAFTRT